MKKNISVHTKKGTAIHSPLDETEKDFSEISIEFGKIVRSGSLAVKKLVKATLRKELSHVNKNEVRLIHGKA